VVGENGLDAITKGGARNQNGRTWVRALTWSPPKYVKGGDEGVKNVDRVDNYLGLKKGKKRECKKKRKGRVGVTRVWRMCMGAEGGTKKQLEARLTSKFKKTKLGAQGKRKKNPPGIVKVRSRGGEVGGFGSEKKKLEKDKALWA